MLIIESEALTGIELSNNRLSGDFPSEYFVENKFHSLVFVNLNFNLIDIPTHCLRYAICYKSKPVTH